MNIEEAKNIVAIKYGYRDWNDLYWESSAHELYEYENEAALLHTKHHVEQALTASYSDSKLNLRSFKTDESNLTDSVLTEFFEITIHKESILNAYSIENIQ